MIVFGSALGFASWAVSLGQREAVLATAREVPAGERIELADLRSVDVAADTGLSVLRVEDRDRVVGQLARVTIPAGSLIQPPHLSAKSVIPAGSVVVGVSISPGAMPTSKLGVGDRVSVIRAEPNTAQDLGTASVFSVARAHSSSPDMLVSLLVTAGSAMSISQAAGADQVRLALVEQLSGQGT
ncbi:MAG: hypothetical protein AVDCRST_MAG50-3040 [uncultured Acidimicrobiales bacterium]|uniref:SAF domain-containing protein n=1 Tax=uncultured Acidimicrobiales bacterium TaxID=310071 RepID=A0A6J4J0V8_9ACTN|nr:MAG: hypothetical protein AVDCRST_MAG50-3040 [uncultured Acidimicrobiales bacterium]